MEYLKYSKENHDKIFIFFSSFILIILVAFLEIF